MRMLLRWCLVAGLAACAVPVGAQSPNTATVVVVVLDQSDARVSESAVTIVNAETGLSREASSDHLGSATFAALPLGGSYTIRVAKTGLTPEAVENITLRAGATSTVHVRLRVAGQTSDVTVYGTAVGVQSDPQIGHAFDSLSIDETPILGRKITTLPLLNAAFRQGKGTGDLFVNATYFVTGAGSRRTTAFMLDGASNDEAWGRQTMLAAVPLGAVEEVAVLSNAFSSEFGWSSGSAPCQNSTSEA